MLDRYSQMAKRTLFLARYEAAQYGSATIEPEHLLIGLLRDPKSRANRYFNLPLHAEGMLLRLREHLGKPVQHPHKGRLPFSTQSKIVLRYAAEEARRGGHAAIGTPQLAIAILRETNSFAARVLESAGFEVLKMREKLLAEQGPPKKSGSFAKLLGLFK